MIKIVWSENLDGQKLFFFGCPELRSRFGNMFFQIDNTVREKTPSLIRKVENQIKKWSKKLPRNKAAKEWIKNN